MFVYDSTKNSRQNLQIHNDMEAENYLNNLHSNVEKINTIALNRILEQYYKRGFIKEPSVDCLRRSLINNPLAVVSIAKNISINASRQGTKTEKAILEGIKNSLENKNSNIEFNPLPAGGSQALRPVSSGGFIRANKVSKEKNSSEYLKTIDASFKISLENETKTGYVFAKVVEGKGGHQDNVQKEAAAFIGWAKQESHKNIYVVLLDSSSGNDYSFLKSNLPDNIWVVNHKELQEKILDEFNK